MVVVPTVTTQDADDIFSDNGTYSATLNGTITNTGGENCDRRGFEWGPSSGNYTQGYVYEDGFGTGAFDLPYHFQGTVYYRAIARNSAGYGYGNEMHFHSPDPPPDPPTNVQATDGTYTDKVRITWTKSEGAIAYQVYRNGTPLGWVGDVAQDDDWEAGAPYINGGDADATDGTYIEYVFLSLSDAGAVNGTTHTYKVIARGSGGDSGYSGTNTGYRGPGPLNYQWYRSAGDSDGSYTYIPGAESSVYSDYGAPENGDGRYYKCYLSAAGCSAQWSSPDRGYRDVAVEVTSMIGGPTGWVWDTISVGVSVVPRTTDGGLTWSWVTAVGVITIPVGGPLSWSWQEYGFV